MKKKSLIEENMKMGMIIKNNIYIFVEFKKNLLINKKRNIRRKKINDNMNLFNSMLEQMYKLNKTITNKIKLINKINDSTHYIITNKIQFEYNKIKSIHKKDEIMKLILDLRKINLNFVTLIQKK